MGAATARRPLEADDQAEGTAATEQLLELASAGDGATEVLAEADGGAEEARVRPRRERSGSRQLWRAGLAGARPGLKQHGPDGGETPAGPFSSWRTRGT